MAHNPGDKDKLFFISLAGSIICVFLFFNSKDEHKSIIWPFLCIFIAGLLVSQEK
jgi:hypothetical protein